jgi:hypothetical protein
VPDRLAVDAEPAGAVGHQALALGGADRLAQVRLLAQAVFALAAFRRVERNDVIALFDAGDARPDIDHDAGALMAENAGKPPFAIQSGQGVGVGMADAGRLDFDQHLSRPRAVQLDGFDAQRFTSLERHRGANIHVALP